MKRLCSFPAIALAAALAGCAGPETLGVSADAVASANSKEVIVSPNTATLSIGETQQFSAQYFVGGKQKKALFTWSSSDEAVATVSASGLVTAVAGGAATITATTSSTTGTAQVTVRMAPPTVVAHIPVGGNPFGSTVSADTTAWVGQLFAGTAQRLTWPPPSSPAAP